MSSSGFSYGQVPAPKTAADVSGTPSATVMPPAYVELVARMAYLWGWPLVNNLNRSMGIKDLPEPGRLGGIVPASPPGYISMLTDYIDAAEKFVTCPNQDTVYGAGYQRLDSKPVVVQVPGLRRSISYVSDLRCAHRFVRADRQAIRHEARLLSPRRAELEGRATARHYGGLSSNRQPANFSRT